MTEPNNIGLLGSGVHRDPLKAFGRRLVFARHLSSPNEPAKLGSAVMILSAGHNEIREAP
jgi:hypothetical protein